MATWRSTQRSIRACGFDRLQRRRCQITEDRLASLAAIGAGRTLSAGRVGFSLEWRLRQVDFARRARPASAKLICQATNRCGLTLISRVNSVERSEISLERPVTTLFQGKAHQHRCHDRWIDEKTVIGKATPRPSRSSNHRRACRPRGEGHRDPSLRSRVQAGGRQSRQVRLARPGDVSVACREQFHERDVQAPAGRESCAGHRSQLLPDSPRSIERVPRQAG